MITAEAEARRKRLGRAGEHIAVVVATLHGLRIIGRNIRIPGCGEIDLLAREGRTLVVVEVKARRRGEAAAAVDDERRQRLGRCGEVLLADRRQRWAKAIRFDVIALDGVRPRHLRAAFEPPDGRVARQFPRTHPSA